MTLTAVVLQMASAIACAHTLTHLGGKTEPHVFWVPSQYPHTQMPRGAEPCIDMWEWDNTKLSQAFEEIVKPLPTTSWKINMQARLQMKHYDLPVMLITFIVVHATGTS